MGVGLLSAPPGGTIVDFVDRLAVSPRLVGAGELRDGRICEGTQVFASNGENVSKDDED